MYVSTLCPRDMIRHRLWATVLPLKSRQTAPSKLGRRSLGDGVPDVNKGPWAMPHLCSSHRPRPRRKLAACRRGLEKPGSSTGIVDGPVPCENGAGHQAQGTRIKVAHVVPLPPVATPVPLTERKLLVQPSASAAQGMAGWRQTHVLRTVCFLLSFPRRFVWLLLALVAWGRVMVIHDGLGATKHMEPCRLHGKHAMNDWLAIMFSLGVGTRNGE